MNTFLTGLGLGGSLIIAIGAQNAFVLRQGLRREYVFLTAALSTLCDWLLITLGAAGFGSLIASVPVLRTLFGAGGAAFLLFYGAASFRSAFRPTSLQASLMDNPHGEEKSRKATALTAVAVSLLNPHAILDTVVVIGGMAGQYAPAPRLLFALGAASTSLLWFFGLAYGARLLAPFLRSRGAWQVLDTLIGLVMWGIAVMLLVELFAR